MTVQIITNSNGLGMEQDVAVLREAIEAIHPGSEVVYSHWQKPTKVPSGHFDLNIFGEFLNAAFFPQAKRSVYVPNPEWCDSRFTPLVRRVDEVWAKTHDTERIFARLHKRAIYTGWTSPDRWAPGSRQKAMLHVAGGSTAKGTPQIFEAMSKLPEYTLTMVASHPWKHVPPNVRLLGRQSDEALSVLMNEHRIHLCPSSYEGFGHYINEARSCEALVITTNAPPMNEMIRPEYGIGAAATSGLRQNLAEHKHVDLGSLIACIHAAMGASDEALRTIGERARGAYLSDREAFMGNLKTLL